MKNDHYQSDYKNRDGARTVSKTQLKPKSLWKNFALFFQYLFVVDRLILHGDAQHVYPGGHRSHIDAFQTVWLGADQTACKVIQFNALGLVAVVEAEG